MKSEIQSQKQSASNTQADALATWAYGYLVKGKRRNYPSLSEPKKTTFEAAKLHRDIEDTGAELLKDAQLLKNYFSPSIASECLASAGSRLVRLLVDMASSDSSALESLYGIALESVIALEKLSQDKRRLKLIRALASKQSMWPVPYSPHPRWKRRLDDHMKVIQLGERNFQKLKGARDTDKIGAGKFARRMGLTLWEIHERNLGLKFSMARPGNVTAGQWEKQRQSQGWPLWMIRLFQLPKLTRETAPSWFDVGWELLKAATGANVASVPELARLGKSNADYGRRYATTGRGQSGNQNSRVESQIKKLLQKAFLARFGNPA